MSKKILMLDSKKTISDGIKYSIERADYKVDLLHEVQQIYNFLSKKNYDAIIFDIDFPNINSTEVIKNIKTRWDIPIICITTSNNEIEKLFMYEAGIEDYMNRPINARELTAKLNVILKRKETNFVEEKYSLKFQNFELRIVGQKVIKNKKVINLTTKEFDILYVLAMGNGKVFSRIELMKIIWGEKQVDEFRVVDVHIKSLRNKIEDDIKNPYYIMTKWGEGYYFNPNIKLI